MHRFLLFLPLLACGPSDQSIRTLEPIVSVTPPAVDYGEVAALRSVDELVYIANTGQATLEVSLSLQGDNPNQFSIPIETFEIERNEQPFTLPVTFAPKTYLPYAATLVVETNDKETPVVEVPLTGEGIYVPTPDICVNPRSLDWGDVAANESVSLVLTVENCGDSQLELGTLSQSGSGAFRLESLTDPSGAILDEGETQVVVVYYEPTHEDGDNGTLTIPVLNDPDEDEVEVVLLGNGGGNFEYPEAIIDCPNGAAPPEVVQFDGSDSFDPGGLPLIYSWSLLQKPDGSQAELSETFLDTTSIFADLGGLYEVQLQVVTAGGIASVPATCLIDAIPADDIHVELTWNTTGVDLDLHMLQNTSAEIYDTPDDCNWCNKNPDWGAAGSADDPRLDLDDRSDGPENINILTPADGAYPVVVHYYPGSNTPTTATVKIYAFGVEIHTVSHVLNENEVWEVGQVNWPDATFGEYPVNITNATRQSCN